MTEQDAAALVVTYLSELGFEVYQEVTFPEGVIADIVAVRGLECWIVEVKTAWSLALLEQCRQHKLWGHGNRIFAAVPISRNQEDHQRLFLDCGFGTILIGCAAPTGTGPKLGKMAPKLTWRPIQTTLKMLHSGYQTSAKAGAPSAAGRWTPFAQTCRFLHQEVLKEPGLSVKDAMSRIKHHYASEASARSSMLSWIEAGRMPGVRAERDGKLFRLFPVAS